MIRAQTFLLYGATDSSKSSQLGEFAQWEFSHNNRISRLVSADSSWDPVIDMVASPSRPLGLEYVDIEGTKRFVCIEAWNIQGLSDPWSVFIELSEGYWPKVVSAGEGRSKLRMTQPSLSDGWIVAQGSDGKSWQVGQYLLEGLSTFASVGLQDHQRTARKLSQDVVGTFSSTIDTETSTGVKAPVTMSFSAASPSHYGQVQRFLSEDLVPRFGKLNVSRVVWTAHEAKGKDSVTGIDKSALGVDAGGPAVVDKTVQKFGHSFHLTVETTLVAAKPPLTGQVAQREFKAWFVSHPDQTLTKMQWPAKVSLSPPQSRALLKRFPGGFIPITSQGLGVYLDFLEKGV